VKGGSTHASVHHLGIDFVACLFFSLASDAFFSLYLRAHAYIAQQAIGEGKVKLE